MGAKLSMGAYFVSHELRTVARRAITSSELTGRANEVVEVHELNLEDICEIRCQKRKEKKEDNVGDWIVERRHTLT